MRASEGTLAADVWNGASSQVSMTVLGRGGNGMTRSHSELVEGTAPAPASPSRLRTTRKVSATCLWAPRAQTAGCASPDRRGSGRIKDVIIVHGRNYHATHIERAATRVSEVEDSGCAAFAVRTATSEGVAAARDLYEAGALGEPVTS